MMKPVLKELDTSMSQGKIDEKTGMNPFVLASLMNKGGKKGFGGGLGKIGMLGMLGGGGGGELAKGLMMANMIKTEF